jgi:hypothetical protein
VRLRAPVRFWLLYRFFPDIPRLTGLGANSPAELMICTSL